MQVMENREKYKLNYAELDLGNEDIQEYPSYESAYSVALTMKETSELCYDNNL